MNDPIHVQLFRAITTRCRQKDWSLPEKRPAALFPMPHWLEVIEIGF
jgi:hypothetical protein